jgi:hypothetical protein
MRARGPRTAPLSGAGGLDSHRQIGFFRGFGIAPFRERVSSRQPPVSPTGTMSRAVSPLKLCRYDRIARSVLQYERNQDEQPRNC